MMEWIKHLPVEPAQFIYSGIAIGGGVARYLNNYINGKGFTLRIFVASVFVAAFSGYMFNLVGISLNLPATFISIMAGVGGFFGEQTMKMVLEYVQGNIPTAGDKAGV